MTDDHCPYCSSYPVGPSQEIWRDYAEYTSALRQTEGLPALTELVARPVDLPDCLEDLPVLGEEIAQLRAGPRLHEPCECGAPGCVHGVAGPCFDKLAGEIGDALLMWVEALPDRRVWTLDPSPPRWSWCTACDALSVPTIRWTVSEITLAPGEDSGEPTLVGCDLRSVEDARALVRGRSTSAVAPRPRGMCEDAPCCGCCP